MQAPSYLSTRARSLVHWVALLSIVGTLFVAQPLRCVQAQGTEESTEGHDHSDHSHEHGFETLLPSITNAESLNPETNGIVDESGVLLDDHFEQDNVVMDAATEARAAVMMQPGYGMRPVEAATVTDPGIVGKWSEVEQWPIVAVHTSLLTNGKVMAFDSTSDTIPQSTEVHSTTRAIVWDPATSAIERVDVDTGWNLFCSGHAHLPDGSLYLAGGNLDKKLTGLDKTHIFNSETNDWTQEGTMYAGRWYPTVASMPNGEMLIVSGYSVPDVWPYPEVRATDGTLRKLSTANLIAGYYPWIQSAPKGGMFMVGPKPIMRRLNTEGTGSWSYMAQRDNVDRLYGSYAMYDIGRFIVSGGGPSLTSSIITNINSGNAYTGTTGSMQIGRRQHTLTILPDGTVLATGGNSSGVNYVDLNNGVYAAEQWNPVTGQWTLLSSMQITRQYHSTALLLPDGRVLAAGGGLCKDCAPLGYLAKSAEVFSPPYLFKKDGSGELAPRPTVLSAPSGVAAYNTQFSVRMENAAPVQKVALVGLGSVTHSTNMGQRYIPMNFSQTSDTLQVTSPLNSNIAPPGYYMLFVIDSNGVPSVAKMLQVGVENPNSTSTMTLVTEPPGLQLTVNGATVTTPHSIVSRVGQPHQIGVVSPQPVNGVAHEWTWWSDGGPASHTITATISDQIYTALFQPQVKNDLILTDGFEGGNLNVWPTSNIDGGNLGASPIAALSGGYGLLAQINDNNILSVNDTTPNGEKRYRARFYFDPNSTTMAQNDMLELFRGFTGSWPAVVEIQMRFFNGKYQVRANLLDDASSWRYGLWLDLSDNSHYFEIDWKAASAAGANNGALTFWLDGVRRSELTGIDNDTRVVDLVRLGAISGIDTGTRGNFYFDDFESRKQYYIGAVKTIATSTITLSTEPPGLQLTWDGATVTTPHAIEIPEGQPHQIGVVSPQTVNGVTYDWVSWSDGGTASHAITTTASDQSFTALFQPQIQIATSLITLTTEPTGLQVTLDGITVTTPYAIESPEGQLHQVGVVSPQPVNGVTYDWASWSDGGPASHAITTTISDQTITARFQPQIINDLILADDFEAGNLYAWPSRTIDNGDLNASSTAALSGGYGLLAQINDNNILSVNDTTPNGEKRYRARFYFDPNSTTMAQNDMLELFRGFTGNWPAVVEIQMRFYNNKYQVRAGALNDAATWQHSLWFDLTDNAHFLEIDWKAASAAGANNGVLTFWLDNAQRAELRGIDNDTRVVDLVRLGAISGIDPGTRGNFYFDDFESRKVNYIGPAIGVATSLITLTTEPPGLQVTLDGITVTTPYAIESPEGQPHQVGVVSPQPVNGVTYDWVSWSDGGTANHSIATTVSDQTITARFQPQVQNDLILADDFEAGNLYAWPSRTIDNGDLNASPTAALSGGYGLLAQINDNNILSVNDTTPNGEKRYRARFYFDPNSTTMAQNDMLELFRGFTGNWPAVVEIQMRFYNNKYQVRAGVLNDATTWRHSLWFDLSDNSHYFEIDWKAASAAGANNGALTFWLDGVQRSELTGIDNDTRVVDLVRLGAISGIDTGTRGNFYFDDFESRKVNYIGPAAGAPQVAAMAGDPAELTAWTEEEMTQEVMPPTEEEQGSPPDLYLPWINP